MSSQKLPNSVPSVTRLAVLKIGSSEALVPLSTDWARPLLALRAKRLADRAAGQGRTRGARRDGDLEIAALPTEAGGRLADRAQPPEWHPCAMPALPLGPVHQPGVPGGDALVILPRVPALR